MASGLSRLLLHLHLHKPDKFVEIREISTPISLHTPQHRYPKSGSRESHYMYRPPRCSETHVYADTASSIASSVVLDADDDDGGGGGGGKSAGGRKASFLLGYMALLMALAVAAPVRGQSLCKEERKKKKKEEEKKKKKKQEEHDDAPRKGKVVGFAAYEDAVVEGKWEGE